MIKLVLIKPTELNRLGVEPGAGLQRLDALVAGPDVARDRAADADANMAPPATARTMMRSGSSS